MHELCECGEHYYDAEYYSTCYSCYEERRSYYEDCIYCGRWHSPQYDTCYQCRRSGGEQRQEAARSLRDYIMWRDGFRCRSCGSSKELHIDHIKPCAKGGDANPWNLQALCRQENLVKADMWIPGGQWDRFRRELIGYYFLAGRGWLDADQMTALRIEVDEIRSESRYRRARGLPPLQAFVPRPLEGAR